jgi:hypothetical protein
MIMNYQQTICRIDLTDIIIDNYQRNLNNARVQRIAANFDPNKVGVLVVSRRGTNSYAVIDGQHRLCAMRKMGIPSANCIIIEDLTYEQEADFFRKQAVNSQPLSSLALYNAGIAAGDEHYLGIQAALAKNKYKTGNISESRTITAVNALSRVMWIFGADVLDLTLQYISAAWRGDPTALRREMLAGIAEFAKRFGSQVTPEMFARRFGNWLPADIFYEFRRRAEGRLNAQNAFNPYFRRLLCVILSERFNKGIGGTSKMRLRVED